MAEKIVMLALSPTMETGTLVKWLKKPGDLIATGDILCEVETDKASMEYESIQEGTLLAITAEEGDSVRVGETIAIIGEKGEDISDLQAGAPAGPEGKENPSGSAPTEEHTPIVIKRPVRRITASPLARKIARNKNIPLESIRGSGPDGRIIKRDLEHAAPGRQEASQSISPEDTREKVSGKRKIIAQRLIESKQQAPHYYEKVRVIMDGLLEARSRINLSRDRKISVNAYLIKFAAEALKRHPVMRSSWQGDEIVTHGRIDIGLAVALDDGLITPVVRDCGSRSIGEIDEELSGLISRSRAGKLSPEEYTGAVFTISNLGSRGIEEFTAIINPPASAILAVGAALPEPAVSDDRSLTVKTLAAFTLSCDHRVIDGAEAASFLMDLKAIIEYPVDIMI